MKAAQSTLKEKCEEVSGKVDANKQQVHDDKTQLTERQWRELDDLRDEMQMCIRDRSCWSLNFSPESRTQRKSSKEDNQSLKEGQKSTDQKIEEGQRENQKNMELLKEEFNNQINETNRRMEDCLLYTSRCV